MAKIRKILDESEVLVIRMHNTSAIISLEEIAKDLLEKDPDTALKLTDAIGKLHSVSNFLETKCTSERNRQVL